MVNSCYRSLVLGILPAAVLVIVGVMAPSANAQERYQDLFRAGLRAYELRHWREALVFFEAAAHAKPRPGGTVRQYGMWKAPYLPYFYQGLALTELGFYAEALRVWQMAEAEGPLLTRAYRRQAREVARHRELIRQLLGPAVSQLSRGAAQDYQTLAEINERLPNTKKPFDLPPLQSIQDLLQKSEELRDDSLVASAEQLAAARKLLAQSRAAIEALHLRVVEHEKRVESERRKTAIAQRRQRILSILEVAEDLAPLGTCDPTAIEMFEAVESEGWPQLSLRSGEVVYPRLRLARAYLDCRYLALAGILIDREKEKELGAASDDLISALERQLEELSSSGAEPKREPPIEQKDSSEDQVFSTSSDELKQMAQLLEISVRSRLGLCQGEGLDKELESFRTGINQLENGLLQSVGIVDGIELLAARDARACGDLARLERHLGSLMHEPESSEIAALNQWLRDQPRLAAGGSHALLVAASDYSSAPGWPALYSPAQDVREIRRVLESHGFEVETLEDPTFHALRDALDSFFFRHGSDPEHRLVFYYAGHGHTEETKHGVKLGFLVPVDAGHPRNGRENLQNLFGMERFREYAIRSNANDMLFMFDSCFAGTVFEATRSCLPPGCQPDQKPEHGLADLVAKPVRMFLTAGDETQMVPDQSLFRLMVTRALQGEGDLDHDRFILGRELGAFVHDRVSEAQDRLKSQYRSARLGPPPAVPLWGTLTEAEFGQGDLAFRAPAGAVASSALSGEESNNSELTTELRYWKAAQITGKAEDYKRILRRFPNGAFSSLARVLATLPVQ